MFRKRNSRGKNMGRGNWKPNRQVEELGYRLFYIDQSDIYPDHDYDIYYFQNFLIGALTHLPKSFNRIYPDSQWRDNNQLVAQNKLFDLLIADNEWSIAVCLAVIDMPSDYWREHASIIPLARQNMDRTFESFVRKLNQQYKIYFRTSAWTSGSVEIGEY